MHSSKYFTVHERHIVRRKIRAYMHLLLSALKSEIRIEYATGRYVWSASRTRFPSPVIINKLFHDHQLLFRSIDFRFAFGEINLFYIRFGLTPTSVFQQASPNRGPFYAHSSDPNCTNLIEIAAAYLVFMSSSHHQWATRSPGFMVGGGRPWWHHRSGRPTDT